MVEKKKGTNYLDTMFVCSVDYPISETDYCITGNCPGEISALELYCVVVAGNRCDSMVCYTFASRQRGFN
ncbi:MAG: hypothetical protein R2879_00105 [Saprospiraceae bacterium]